MWTRLRDNLKTSKLITTDWSDWNTYIDKINLFIPDKNPSTQYYLITDGGWVYEGTITEIKKCYIKCPLLCKTFTYLQKTTHGLLYIVKMELVCFRFVKRIFAIHYAACLNHLATIAALASPPLMPLQH